MANIQVPKDYRIARVDPFVRLGVEGVTPHLIEELISLYQANGNMDVDFGPVLDYGHCKYFRAGIYEPDVFVATYAKFAEYTRRNPDSIIMTGLGESILETMLKFIDDLKKVVGLEVNPPTHHFDEDMEITDSQISGLLSEEVKKRSLSEQMLDYEKKVRTTVQKRD